MAVQETLSSFFKNAEQIASDVLETVTDTVAGKASDLRNGTEFDPVSLPRDLAAHADVQTEWWYYTGHAVTDSGRKFGFELVFFKRRTDLDRFAVIPLRLIGNPFFFAHFAITDHSSRTFRYSHRKSSNGRLDLPATASEEHFYLRLGDWTARSASETHVLSASLNEEVFFEASLTPSKPVVLNGINGVSYKDEGEASRYFSYTRMQLEGDLTTQGQVEHFTGTAWMDREFGTWEPTENQKGWDWFSIQLDNGCELMVYQLRNPKGEPTRFSTGKFNAADGTTSSIAADSFSIEVTETWESPRSDAVYPSGWRLSVPDFGLELEIEPVLKDQELDTRGTTMIVYWEGACSVKGQLGDEPVGGNAYVELVGYDRSHEKPDLSRFLIGDYLEYLGL